MRKWSYNIYKNNYTLDEVKSIMDFFKQHEEQIEKFFEGESVDSYKFMGSHPTGEGCHFAVLAPNADNVAVTGTFNDWDEEGIPMQKERGIWHVFIPDVGIGTVYKYVITKNGNTVMKSDPYAFSSELRPATGSVVWEDDPQFQWTDKAYFNYKASIDITNSPVNIYEVHLGSFRQKEDGSFMNFREIVPILTNYLLEMGYNYIELLPVCEHPLDASWGYQTTGYYSITPRYGNPDDFKYFVNYLHSANIGVILDWVPGHFCRDSHGLYRFDGTPTFESDNVQKADNPGWGTCNFDFSRTYVRSFLKSNAFYLFSNFHIDGIRVDAVANLLTFDFGKQRTPALKNKYGSYENIEAICFLRDLNTSIKTEFPGTFTCAEDSSDYPGITHPAEIGGLNFTFKWNMGWMNDSLEYMKHDPIYRKSLHDKMTFVLFYAFAERFILPLSHDEVVHGKCSMLEKMPSYRVDKFAQLRAYYTYMYGIPGKKLQFMGNEFGHSLEWRFYDSLEWELLHYDEYSGLKAFCSELNHIYLKSPAMWEQDTGWEGFGWCDAGDRDRSVYSFARYGKNKEDTLIFIMNFTPMHYGDYHLGVPYFTEYKEILNSDNLLYGGQNRINHGLMIPKTESVGEMPYYLNINLAPFGAIILKPFDPYAKKEKEEEK